VAANYPTLGDVGHLLDRTAAARAQVEAALAGTQPFTQTQHLNFALYLADAAVQAKTALPPTLKTAVDAAKPLVVA
jgi:hypothetical protein